METKVLVLVFLFMLVVGVLTSVFIYDKDCDETSVRRTSTENQFGDSGCVNNVIEKWEIDKNKEIKRGTIFVSIASYRDVECSDTLNSMYDNARYPDRIFAGVVQQNKKKNEDCLNKCPKCKERKEAGQIRTLDFNFKEAKGPCFARYQATKLWDGEEFFLQIDSHTRFDKHWDVTVMEEFRSANDPKAVISGYPPTRSQFTEIVSKNYKTFSMMCDTKLNDDGLPQVTARLLSVPEDHRPVPVAYAGAGLMFMSHQALFEVPYDPHLNFLFFGEELLYSARLWTHGFNIYNPTKIFISHHYERPGPKFWDDNKEFEGCRQRAIARVKYLLGLGEFNEIEEDFAEETDKFSVGTIRSLEEYWKFMNVDFKQKKVDMCKVDAYT